MVTGAAHGSTKNSKVVAAAGYLKNEDGGIKLVGEAKGSGFILP